jgi:hypothetical protein
MNPILYALQQLRFQIPLQILQRTFFSLINPQTTTPISMDARIREEVIEPRVLLDCDLFGGTELTIPLHNEWREIVDPYITIFRIPKRMTQGRSITRALSVAYGLGSVTGYGSLVPTEGNAMLDAAAGVMQSAMPITNVSTSRCQIIGENTIMITDVMVLPISMYLRCWVANDDNLNHLQTTAYGDFAKGVEYATKAFIYMTNQIPMDQGFLMGGQQLGTYKSIVDGYADANDNYTLWLNETWRKVAACNDGEATRRRIQQIMGGLN